MLCWNRAGVKIIERSRWCSSWPSKPPTLTHKLLWTVIAAVIKFLTLVSLQMVRHDIPASCAEGAQATGQISAFFFGLHQPQMSNETNSNFNEPKREFRFSVFAKLLVGGGVTFLLSFPLWRIPELTSALLAITHKALMLSGKNEKDWRLSGHLPPTDSSPIHRSPLPRPSLTLHWED